MNQPESPLPFVPTILLLLLLMACLVHGETIVDPNFSPQLPNYAVVNAAQPDGSGRLIVGGSFGSPGSGAQNIARLLPNGSVDTTFAGSADHSVSSISLDSSGIVLGGSFSSVNGKPRGGLARLLSDGSLAAGFGEAPGGNGSIDALLPLPDGTIIVGGSFSSFNASSVFYLADIAADNSLNVIPSVSPSPAIEAGVFALAAQTDGKVLVSGLFNTPRGAETLVRLNTDGSLDITFAQDHGPILYPNAIATLPDGRALVAGVASPDGKGFLRRLLADGSVDSTFPEVGFDGAVYAVTVQSDGRILAGGNFQTAAGVPHASLARFSAEGVIDASLNLPVSGVVRVIASDNSAIYIAGVFNAVSGQPANSIARLIDNTPAPIFHATSVTGGFSATLKTDPGQTYVIEASTDLQLWTPISTNIATNIGLQITDPSAAQQQHRFFRARLL